MIDPKETDINASLSSLAMLSVQLRTGKDYLDYMHGFVIEVLQKNGDRPFDAAEIKRLIDEHFGLKIPVATFALYLKRLAKAGTIKPVSGGLQYQVVHLPALSFEKDRASIRAKIKGVTDELAEFAHKHFGLVWDEKMSAAAIANFLRQYSIEFLRFSEAKSPLPAAASNNKTTDYVVASFVTSCATEKPGLFENIKALVQSHILANALMCPDLEKHGKGFKHVFFLADTRILIRALDLESKYETDNTRELLAAIRQLKGTVCIFQETKNELRSVLKAAIRGIQQGTARGMIDRELTKRKRGLADILLLDSRLDEELATLSITVLPSPRYDAAHFLFQIDEPQLREEIANEITYISERAIEHDIRVVRHIYALRKGRISSSVEDCGFVLLTTNSALSRAAFNFERRNASGWFFSAVVTDYHLSHLAWLKSPMDSPRLPRSEILANCYATMRPHESFWFHYLSEVKRLKDEGKISERDHEVLRFSLAASDELMAVTRGDIDGINIENIHIILEKLEKTFAADKEEKLQRERIDHEKTKAAVADFERLSGERESLRVKAVEREYALEIKRFNAEQEIRTLKGNEAATRAAEASRRNRIERIGSRFAKGAFYFAGFIFVIIGIMAVFSGRSILLGIPASVFAFLSLWTGFSGNNVEQYVKRRIIAILMKLIE